MFHLLILAWSWYYQKASEMHLEMTPPLLIISKPLGTKNQWQWKIITSKIAIIINSQRWVQFSRAFLIFIESDACVKTFSLESCYKITCNNPGHDTFIRGFIKPQFNRLISLKFNEEVTSKINHTILRHLLWSTCLAKWVLDSTPGDLGASISLIMIYQHIAIRCKMLTEMCLDPSCLSPFLE